MEEEDPFMECNEEVFKEAAVEGAHLEAEVGLGETEAGEVDHLEGEVDRAEEAVVLK